MKIEVGGVYKTRDGKKVGPLSDACNSYWPFKFGGVWYQYDGVSCRGSRDEMYDTDDLVAPWVEPTYGRWHAHNGGPMPVDGKSKVEAIYTYGKQGEISASGINWSESLLYRVITTPTPEPENDYVTRDELARTLENMRTTGVTSAQGKEMWFYKDDHTYQWDMGRTPPIAKWDTVYHVREVVNP